MKTIIIALAATWVLPAASSTPNLNQLHQYLGFGGATDHFKTYLISGNPDQLSQARLDLAGAIALVEPFAASDPDSRIVYLTLMGLQRAMDQAPMLMDAGHSPAQLLDLVHVPDQQAIQAIARWEAQQPIAQPANYLSWGASGVLAALLLAAGATYQYQTRTKLEQLSDIANQSVMGIDRALIQLKDLGSTERLGLFEMCDDEVINASSLASLMGASRLPKNRTQLMALFPDSVELAATHHINHRHQNLLTLDFAQNERLFRLILLPITPQGRVIGGVQSFALTSNSTLLAKGAQSERKASKRGLRIHELTQRLRQTRTRVEQLEKRASTDSLTGVLSRQGLLDQLQIEVRRAQRSGQTLGILVLDLNRFTHINHQYGKDVGDDCLNMVACLLKRLTRSGSGDLVGRIEADRFAVILGGGNEKLALRTLKMVQTLLAQEKIPGITDTEARLQVCGGVATLNPENDDPGNVLRVANDARLLAKESLAG